MMFAGRYFTLVTVALVGSTAQAATSAAKDVYPPFRWDRVPVSAHLGKTPGDFTAEEVRFLAERFSLVCIEKAHGLAQYGNTEDGTIAAIRQLKAINPKIKILFYWNTFIDYPLYKKRIDPARNPDWHLARPDGTPILKPVASGGPGNGQPYFNLANAELREWWTEQARAMCREGGADGIFLDAVQQVRSPRWERELGREGYRQLTDGLVELFKLVRQKIGPEKTILFNGLRTVDGRPTHGLDLLPLADGVMIEHFGHFQSSSPESMAADIEAVTRAGKAGKIVVFKAWPGFTWLDEPMMARPQAELIELARQRITFPLACFLVAAQEDSSFCYTWGYREDHGAFAWYPEFDKPLGPPRGDAVRDGFTYTRQFEHASVWMNLETRQARIDWKK